MAFLYCLWHITRILIRNLLLYVSWQRKHEVILTIAYVELTEKKTVKRLTIDFTEMYPFSRWISAIHRIAPLIS